MNIERLGPEEILIRFDANPSANEAQMWSEQVASQLAGKEKIARVDVTKLPVLSSLLIGVIMKIFRAMERQGGTISVEISNEDILKVFKVFNLTALFEVKVLHP